ncbi:hypothetical protein GOV10_04255 [Candidatus Woesearchaeota archaeon]|nr:hypothetical protein [Candidatus Woesearchaeota archaeon]
MVLESIISPHKAEQKPAIMLLLGFIYATVGVFLSLMVFRTHSSMIMVFLAAMASIPLIYNMIIMEEEKDLQGMGEGWLLKEHAKALSVFIWLFIGMTIAFSLWYSVLSPETVSVLFQSQSDTINSINGRATGFVGSQFESFSSIFLNNVRVLVFCILFSFLYGSGAIFILSWNASVIGAAMGNIIRTELASIATNIGSPTIIHYFQIGTYSLFRYVIHGIPEILAYFMAGLAGGIISIAAIRHDFGTKKFEHILLDSADLLLLALVTVFIAGVLEVWITPLIF